MGLMDFIKKQFIDKKSGSWCALTGYRMRGAANSCSGSVK